MAFNNRIESAIACLLKFWDDYLMDQDNVAFLKYNLNIEHTFSLEPKNRNSFAKRDAIERSTSPKERTCLYDAIIEGYKILRHSANKQGRKYLILISDGADTASIKEWQDAFNIIDAHAWEYTFIGIGMGLNEEEVSKLEPLCVHSLEGKYMDFELSECIKTFEVISGYAAHSDDLEYYREYI